MTERQKIYRAGVIPYYTDDTGTIRMLFMKPSNTQYGGDLDPNTGDYVIRYQLAKGRVEKYEKPEEAALREGEEEVGLITDNIMSFHHVGTFLGRTDVYIARIKDPNNFKPYHYETESIKWLTLEEFDREGRELHRDLVHQSHFIMEMNEEYVSYQQY